MSAEENQNDHQSTVSQEKLAEILAWGREKFPDFADNIKLITKAYNNHHVATKVKDCIGGARATLKLLFVSEYQPNKYQLCKKCFKKQCDCGEQDYDEMESYGFQAGDATGVISVKLAPWDKLPKPDTEKVYDVEGFVKEYNGYISLQAKKITPSSPTVAQSVEVKSEKPVAVVKPTVIDNSLSHPATLPATDDEITKASVAGKQILAMSDNTIVLEDYRTVLRNRGFSPAAIEKSIEKLGGKILENDGNEILSI